MPDWEARCKLVEAENEALRARIDELEECLGVTFPAPPWLGLTPSEAAVFGALLARDAVTKSLIMSTLYGSRPDVDAVEPKIVDVFICKLRAKLEPWNLAIETNWGVGYYMTPAMRDRARKLIEERAAA